jgi:uncharacterized protein YegP (UPF0339 family)
VIGPVLAGLLLVSVLGTVSPHPAAAQDKAKAKAKAPQTKAPTKEAKAAAIFELYKDKSGEFRFRLKDDEGTVLAISGKGYPEKTDCQKAIQAIQREAARARIDDQSR